MAVPATGQIIDRYCVDGVIGAGSMGDVVKAIDVDLKRTVAIKILSDKHRGNEELEARFVREGRAVAAISHSNVVQVFTTGNWDERPYIAMEFLEGTDLGSLIAQHGPMSSLDAARAVLDSARGLNAAFEAGLIHRDVKPANLVKLDNGNTKVTDFGLAKPVDPKNEPALTAMGVVVGTPDYIAPEQARGEAIDEKVDIYALGGTLYYLLVGKPPFRKGNALDDKYLKVVARHLRDPAPNAMVAQPETDGPLARLQLRMMAKKPEARPSYAELTTELTEIVQRLGGRTTPAPPAQTQSSEARQVRPGPSAKTPYLGGNRLGTDVTRLANQGLPTQGLESQANAAVHDDDDGAETHVRMPSQEYAAYPPGQTPSASHVAQDSLVAGPTRSKTLTIMTALSGLVLLVGLVLYFVGPLPSAGSEPAVVVANDASPVAIVVAPDATPPPPTPPDGMVLVPAGDNHQAIFISMKHVTYAEFSAMFPNQKKPTKNKTRAARPVTGVEYAYAEAFARTKGGRLPSPAEFAAALELESQGFSAGSVAWEWLDDGTGETQRTRTTANAKGETRAQRPRANNNIGFRIAVDL